MSAWSGASPLPVLVAPPLPSVSPLFYVASASRNRLNMCPAVSVTAAHRTSGCVRSETATLRTVAGGCTARSAECCAPRSPTRGCDRECSIALLVPLRPSVLLCAALALLTSVRLPSVRVGVAWGVAPLGTDCRRPCSTCRKLRRVYRSLLNSPKVRHRV